MTSKSIPPSDGVTPTLLVARVEERSSTDSPNHEPLDVPATPAVLVTPPTPGPYDSSAEIQSGWSPLSPLTDLCDISETSTVCDNTAHTSTSKDEENAANASTAEARSQRCDYSPSTFGMSHPTKVRRGTAASGYSEAVSFISHSYATENGAGEKDGGLDHEAAKAWSNGARAMMELDDANVQRWKEEIDTLLVFAGIFSAVVTGFLTETMRLLRPEPSAATVAILERISTQLRNPQEAMPDLTAERFVPNRHIVQVNSLWFTSLILSLGVAFVGILVKQWLGEYPAALMTVSRSRISKKHMRARQYRHAAFERWYVRAIMTALPFFLLSALILFCGGLSLLLVTMDLKVAIVAICIIGFIFAFSIATTILPSVWSACPYRSPQAFLVFVLIQAALCLCRACARWTYALVSPSPNTSTERELTELRLCPTRSVGGLAGELRKRGLWTRFREWTKRTGGQRTYWSWQEREEAMLLSSRAPYQMALLDELDGVKMDVAVLQGIVRPCILTLALDEAIPCFRNILNRRAEVVVQGLPKWESDLDRETCQVLVDMLLDMLARPELSLSSTLGTAAATDHFLQKHKEVLGMLNRLIGTGHHHSFLGGSYDRIFSILLQYIREPQRQYISQEGAISSLVMMTLATLQDKVPPDTVTKKDVLAVSEYVCTLDNVMSLRVAALAFAMILALPSTGDINSEDLLEAVCSMIRTAGKDIRTSILHGQAPGDELMRLLPSFHVCLSSLEDLLRISPKFLTHDAWSELDLTASRLTANYKAVHQCAYTDSNGRNTDAYLADISRLMEGLEVPPHPAVRRQTSSLEVLIPVTVQEPEPARSPKPPSKATVNWPSWPNLGSFYSKAESDEDLPL